MFNICMKFKIFFAIVILLPVVSFCQDKLNVTMIGSGNRNSDPEISSAYYFLNHNPGIISRYLTFSELTKSPDLLNGTDVLWFHRGDTTEFDKSSTNPEVIGIIKNYISGGGSLFLSLDALRYLIELGLEKTKPQTRKVNLYDEGYGRKAGLHAFRYHPAFEGLNGGAVLYIPYMDESCRQVGYFESSAPSGAKVFAVDWAYIFLHEETKLALEYDYGKGKVIAVGAYMLFARNNASSDHLKLFTNNILKYLSGSKPGQNPLFWDYDKGSVFEVFQKYPEIDKGKSVKWEDNPSSPVIGEVVASNSFWDVAGQRMLIMGNEKGGISEVWSHPFMALRDYSAGIVFSDNDSILWLNDQFPQIEVRPESFKRTYRFRRAYLTETVTCSITDPSGIIHYEYRGVYPAKMIIKFRSNLRLMWPYSGQTAGSIKYSWDDGLNAFVLKNKSEDNICLVGANIIPEKKLAGQYEDIDCKVVHSGNNNTEINLMGVPTDKLQVTSVMEYKLDMNENLDMVIAASGEGLNTSIAVFRDAINSPADVYNKTIKYYQDFSNDKLIITSPDEDFNQGYLWALLATDRFFVNTPGIGKSLVAGYSSTDYGWDGGQKISGRPGYAWFFGRDAEWSSLALLDYGDYEKVKEVLSNFIRYQDINGKIYHELTTSGVVHYDAADATPLFILLAGRYFTYSGDLAFISDIWKTLKKAIDFCYSTDTDGDLLIENTAVGHGWEEGGILFGCHTTLYLASIWAQALKEAAGMAENLNLYKEAEKYKSDALLVKKKINTTFWNEKNKFLYHGIFNDGKFQEEPGIMPSVPMYFQQVDEGKTKVMLEKFAGNSFSSDWGCRILSNESKFFKPSGYHSGSVWPLFTGWVSLAEYKNGRPAQGFSHIMNNLLLYKYWGKGFTEEVLNGLAFKPAGVTHHQCWSETMVLQPAIEGMLGIVPSAARNELNISPGFPAGWDSVNIENIRIGHHSVDFNMKRSKGKIVYRFSHQGEYDLNVHFIPYLPQGTEIKKVKINNSEIPEYKVKSKSNYPCTDISFKISDITSVEVFTYGGIGVLPIISRPKPGYTGENFRLINDFLDGMNYSINLEGVSGSSLEFKCYLADFKIEKISGANLVSYEDNICTISTDFPHNEENYSKRTVTIILK